MKFSSDIVVIDLETSCKTFGNNEIEESNVIEIGAVKLNKHNLDIKNEFSILINPRDYPILPQISGITRITPSMVKDQPYFDEAAKSFLEWYGDRNKSILAGWGIYYDLPLLRKEFRVFGLDYNNHFVGGGLDIRSLALYWLAKRNHSTSGLTVERMFVKMSINADFDFHRALNDAKATALVFQKIVKEL
jgi:DNA polymerase III epsilon subunit-like protein